MTASNRGTSFGSIISEHRKKDIIKAIRDASSPLVCFRNDLEKITVSESFILIDSKSHEIGPICFFSGYNIDICAMYITGFSQGLAQLKKAMYFLSEDGFCIFSVDLSSGIIADYDDDKVIISLLGNMAPK